MVLIKFSAANKHNTPLCFSSGSVIMQIGTIKRDLHNLDFFRVPSWISRPQNLFITFSPSLPSLLFFTS